jgi:methyl-accepting chemotaxis protein
MMRQKLSLVLALSLIALIGLFVYLGTDLGIALRHSGEAVSTHRLAAQNGRELARVAVELQSGERRFLLTGDEQDLIQYTAATVEFNTLLAQSRELVGENRAQQVRLSRIDKLLTEWVEKVALAEIQKRREVELGSASVGDVELLVKGADDSATFDRVAQELADFSAAEEQDMLAKLKDSGSAVQRALLLFGLGIGIALISILTLFFLLTEHAGIRRDK